MNIIIPIGGKGERFKNEGYNLPKPLINIFGKPMILHVVDNLNVRCDDTIYIIYNRELNEYNFKELFNGKKIKNQINFIELNKQTDGAVETVLIGLNTFGLVELEKKIVILDCDTFYSVDILSIYRSQVENSIFCFYDFQDKPIYSYLLVNNSGYITEIKEKVKISMVANSGCYCFKNGNVLLEYCNRIISGGIKERGEFYLSCVISEMLKNGCLFNANILDINNIHCVGTPSQLKTYCANMCRNLTTVDKKRYCFDLDNTLVTFPDINGDYSTDTLICYILL